MRISDYIIAPQSLETTQVTNEWNWLIPTAWTLLALTKFGDLLFKSEKNRVIFLDTLEGSLSDLVEHSEGILDTNEFLTSFSQQLSTDWVDICNERGMQLSMGECFGWKIHPIIGGQFISENIGIFSIRVYESIVGQLLRQLHEKPAEFRISGFATIDPERSNSH